MPRLRLPPWRASSGALALAMLGWAAGCAVPMQALVEPALASRTYTPARIAVLPPDVFVVYDEVGDNDPGASAALGRQVADHLRELVAEGLARRGYAADLTAQWDGLRAADGAALVSRDELAWLAGSITQFASGPSGGGAGPAAAPSFVAPELAAKVGGALGSDALLYVNVKGVAVSPGKRTAQVLGVVFFAAIVAAIVLALIADSRGGGSGGGRGAGSAGRGQNQVRAAPNTGGGGPVVAPRAGTPTQAAVIPRGHGRAPSHGGGRVYGGPHVALGVGVVVPLHGPAHTHQGAVVDDDEAFAGNQANVSLTLVSAYDGRVLWHIRQSVDVELDNPQDIARFVEEALGTLPPSLAAAPPAPTPVVAPAPATPPPVAAPPATAPPPAAPPP